MKIRIYLLCASVILLLATNGVYSQAKKSTSKSKATANKKIVPVPKTETNDLRTTEVARAEAQVTMVLNESGMSFREALLAYMDDNRQIAGEKFNRSVEVFLLSTLNIRREPRLQACFDQLVETIYRIEVSNESLTPRVQNLAKTCGWTIDTKLAESFAQIGRSDRIGFNSQEFEPSPLDDLSTLNNAIVSVSGVRIVKAKAGDTVQKVAERYNADPIEVAKFNGLLPNSVLGAGREIKIPNK